MEGKFFKDLREKVQMYFEEHKGHGFDHTERVYNLALKISNGENLDKDVIKAATLLHDVARGKEEANEELCHAEEGAKMAKEILRGMNWIRNQLCKF